MNKIIFLDIDGPLVTDKIRSEDRNNKWGVDIFDPQCVIILNQILGETGADIVLSSDWKYDHLLKELQEMFIYNKIISLPIDITPKYKTDALKLEGNRAEEIKEWLNLPNRNYKIDNFIVIDDYNLSEHFPNNFAYIGNTKLGLATEGIKEKIINILNGNCPFCNKTGYEPEWYNDLTDEIETEKCNWCEGTGYCNDQDAIDLFHERQKEDEELPF